MGFLAVLHAALESFPAWPAGACGWITAALLWDRISRTHRLLVGIITAIGGGALAMAWWRSGALPLAQAISQNHTLLTMLVAVTFLRLISLPSERSATPLPTGPKALWRTVLGVHLFGAVINISTVIIMADRIAQARPLDRTTALLFSRAFSACAFWSPFIGGTALVLAYVDGAELATLMLVGMPLAACSLALTYWWSRGDADTFHGYPIRFASLWIPALLAIGVLIVHKRLPDVSILIVIAVIATLLTVVVLFLKQGITRAGHAVRHHTEHQLPQLAQELSLFLAAGVLATGIAELIATSGDPFPFSTLNGTTASLTLGAMIMLAVAGIHPIIMVSVISIMVVPISPDPNLAAMMFMMCWAIGVPASPLSGTNLILQGRYNVSSWKLSRWNLKYCLAMYVIATLTLHLYDAL